MKTCLSHSITPTGLEFPNTIFFPNAGSFFEASYSERHPAICFGGPRDGSLDLKGSISNYARLNPDFPHGVKGAFFKAALKKAADSWTQSQIKSASTPLDYKAAILVFSSHPEAISRQNMFINEVTVPQKALATLKLERVYFDDSLMQSPGVEHLKQQGITVRPISECIDQVLSDVQHLRKKPKKKFQGPKG